MSTTDSQGKAPLTRKQLRELRLTGSTPVIVEDAPAPAPVLPRAAEPAPIPPAPTPDAAVDLGAAPLTRRQAREQERIRTASLPVIEPAEAPAPEAPAEETPAEQTPADEAPEAPADEQIVSAVPAFAPVVPQTPAADADAVGEPVVETEELETTERSKDDADADTADEDDADEDDSDEDDSADLADLGVDEDAIEELDDDADEGERPTVNPTFGSNVLSDGRPARPLTPSFDELVGDSRGTQTAPSALIFNPGPGEGSLSGPIASTGEVLITGTYELPEGIGSHGHARGTTDGKEIDAVLLDGELPPASSPTPIAASSAISTSKPAGEVIRPPAPEKGNKLMLALTITAGGLALVLAAALVVAFTTNIL